MEKDIADYAKDGRLTEPSDGKRYEWQKMIDTVKALVLFGKLSASTFFTLNAAIFRAVYRNGMGTL